MYVAMTRARQRLYLSCAQTRLLHGHLRYNLKSRFLDELPGALLKWLTPRIGAGQRVAEPAARYAAPGAPYRSRAAEGLPFRIGQSVDHAKFGQGVILAAEGSGSEARVQVNFGPAGIKWLALAVARLTAA